MSALRIETRSSGFRVGKADVVSGRIGLKLEKRRNQLIFGHGCKPSCKIGYVLQLFRIHLLQPRILLPVFHINHNNLLFTASAWPEA